MFGVLRARGRWGWNLYGLIDRGGFLLSETRLSGSGGRSGRDGVELVGQVYSRVLFSWLRLIYRDDEWNGRTEKEKGMDI